MPRGGRQGSPSRCLGWVGLQRTLRPGPRAGRQPSPGWNAGRGGLKRTARPHPRGGCEGLARSLIWPGELQRVTPAPRRNERPSPRVGRKSSRRLPLRGRRGFVCFPNRSPQSPRVAGVDAALPYQPLNLRRHTRDSPRSRCGLDHRHDPGLDRRCQSRPRLNDRRQIGVRVHTRDMRARFARFF